MSGFPSRMVDAHHHVWDRPNLADYPWMAGAFGPLLRPYRLDDLAPLLGPAQVSATVVVQALADEAETRELLRQTVDHPFLAGVVGWVDLRASDVADRIDALIRGAGGDRLVGLRHGAADEDDPGWLLRDDVQAGLACVGAKGLTFDLEITPRELPAANALVRAHPGLRFVLDHLAKPPIIAGWSPDWERGVTELSAAPNVWCKLSGLVTEADWAAWTVSDLRPYLDKALSAFGPGRLMVGSDWPVCELAGDYHRVLAATVTCLEGLTPAEADRVFAATAIDCYRLTAPAGEGEWP